MNLAMFTGIQKQASVPNMSQIKVGDWPDHRVGSGKFHLSKNKNLVQVIIPKGAFTNYVYKICLFWPPTPLCLHFL